ncbi:MAG: hypothetical protein M3514_09315 [Actinomycetota bacterium]|nr:hypothetical protein [Actinomycetota bacterium]
MSIGDVAADFGKGLFAGAAGTAAMTVSSTLEMKLSGRGASQTPAQAAEEVLGVEPEDEETEAQFSNLVHWGYGTGWGGVRGLLASAGLSGPVATAAHLGLVWGAEQVVLPMLNVSARSSSTVGRRPPRTCSITPSTLQLPGSPTPFWSGARPAREETSVEPAE